MPGNLPAATRWVRIEGGNHAQFGYYGPQLGDRRATITRDQQQRLLVDAIVAALDRASGAHCQPAGRAVIRHRARDEAAAHRDRAMSATDERSAPSSSGASGSAPLAEHSIGGSR